MVILEYFSPVAKIPGPRPAWLCMFKIFYNIGLKYNGELPHKLHQRYGPIMRIGPRGVSIGSSELVRAVYMSYRFRKDDLYKAFDIHGENIFSTRYVQSIYLL
jgi:hypothetical protein